jgi:hypothetical protein
LQKKSTKHQHPSSRETSSSKHQNGTAQFFGGLSLELLWMLVLGAWMFASRLVLFPLSLRAKKINCPFI